ncbi:hypothetical protein [Roseovarius amoyensis]|nr:hypothetical protein [Roseovarius amoyensis]
MVIAEQPGPERPVTSVILLSEVCTALRGMGGFQGSGVIGIDQMDC